MPRPLVLFLSFDALSPLALPCYGNRSHLLPACDLLAAEGTIYYEHFTPSPQPGLAARAWWAGANDSPFFPGEQTLSEQQREELTAPIRQQAFVQFSQMLEQQGGHCYSFVDLSSPVEASEEKEGAESTLEAGTESWQDRPEFQAVQNSSEETPLLYWFRWSAAYFSSGIAAGLRDMDRVLAKLQQWVAELQASNESTAVDVLWIMTAEIGARPALTAESPPAYQAAMSDSLSARLWTPLMTKQYEAADSQAARVNRNLSTPLDVHTLLCQFLSLPVNRDSEQATSRLHSGTETQSEPEHESPQARINQTLASGERFLLLSDEKQMGLRTETDLLVLPQRNSAEAAENGYDTPRWYQKPEDHFDLNDLATTHPERVQTLSEELLQLWETAASASEK